MKTSPSDQNQPPVARQAAHTLPDDFYIKYAIRCHAHATYYPAASVIGFIETAIENACEEHNAVTLAINQHIRSAHVQLLADKAALDEKYRVACILIYEQKADKAELVAIAKKYMANVELTAEGFDAEEFAQFEADRKTVAEAQGGVK